MRLSEAVQEKDDFQQTAEASGKRSRVSIHWSLPRVAYVDGFDRISRSIARRDQRHERCFGDEDYIYINHARRGS